MSRALLDTSGLKQENAAPLMVFRRLFEPACHRQENFDYGDVAQMVRAVDS